MKWTTWTRTQRYILLAGLLCFCLSLAGLCSAEEAYTMTASQLASSRQNLMELSQINKQLAENSIVLQEKLTESQKQTQISSQQSSQAKQELVQAKSELTKVSQALTQANQLATLQAQQILELKTQVTTLQTLTQDQDKLLTNYKKQLKTYLNNHKDINWEIGAGAGYSDSGTKGAIYSIDIQRNVKHNFGIGVEYIGGNGHGVLIVGKILF